ncbi:MAG: DUF4097 family beta strand repeat-containing protein [Dictyoglomaceae bacterium]|nr:DUF4097 family beta strand repeat-containing protein [Dictyoglomaceae bacterium]HPU44168.1 DUF4097 family beta strand repeat-containing protein [Dictyoglomaceae bacterium]
MEDIKKILKLLEEGKITAEEAEKLIEAIENKKEEKKEGFNLGNIGEMISGAISSAVSVVPKVISGSIKARGEVKEEIGWDLEKPFFVEITGGELDIKVGEEPKVIVEGEGVYNLGEDIIKLSVGSFILTIPRFKLIKLKLSAGDVKGKIACDECELYMSMGDMDLELEAKKLTAELSMGDLDINLVSSPEYATLKCNMGDMNIKLPENFDGKVIAKVALGDVSVGRKADVIKDRNCYIYKTGEKSVIEVSCKMGDVTVY